MKPSEATRIFHFLVQAPKQSGGRLASRTDGVAERLVSRVVERDDEANCLKYDSLLHLLGGAEAVRRALKDGGKNVTMYRSLKRTGRR